MLLAIALTLSAAAPPSLSATAVPAPGTWRAVVTGLGGEVPFGLELDVMPGSISGWLRNGRERRRIARVESSPGRVVLHFDPYDSRIEAAVSDDGRQMHGEWIRYRGDGEPSRLPFAAEHNVPWRFSEERDADPDDAAPITGRWRVRFASDTDDSVGIFGQARRADGTPMVSGTFLTPLGDYRYLAGSYRDDRLLLSVFDGAHAFRFDATLSADGTLSGDFWSRDAWHDTFSAERDEHAELEDPFLITRMRSEGRVPWHQLRYHTLNREQRSLGDPSLFGAAQLLVLFGTWCPNCNDETRYLVELERRYRDRGLRIVGLAFEFGDDLERNAVVVRDYAAHHGATWPMLIAGTSDKDDASDRFPLIDRVRAYPTTLFIDHTRRVRAVYTGFSGPATGAAHERLREQFERLIDEMLAEAQAPVEHGR